MKTYIYCADIYCSDCGEKIRAELAGPGQVTPTTPETDYDSDDYPKGPYPDGGRGRGLPPTLRRVRQVPRKPPYRGRRAIHG